MNENKDTIKQPEAVGSRPFLQHGGSGSLCGKSCGRQDKQLNTYDWLADIPGNADECELVEVQFKNTRKGYFRNSNHIPLEKGDIVAVEATPGHDIGTVTLTGRLVPLQIRKANLKPDAELKRIYRKAKATDMDKYKEAKAREHDTMIRSRQIAKDLKRMEVWASVNEADIGSIFKGQDVEFTVDAFPGEKFLGKVNKVRLNATMSQNVVTYIVEVSTDNSNGKLLPYLTANLSFIVKQSKGVLTVPNSALRWVPDVSMLAEGVSAEVPEGKRLVWVQAPENKVKPIAVTIGINDGAYSEVSSPEIKEGMKVITGGEIAKGKTTSQNPFMPKMPQRKKR